MSLSLYVGKLMYEASNISSELSIPVAESRTYLKLTDNLASINDPIDSSTNKIRARVVAAKNCYAASEWGYCVVLKIVL
jgi:hypothetical protein